MIDNAHFLEVGKKFRNISWTDQELEDQIAVLRIVISYLEGRGDCGIVVQSLNRDLLSFTEFYKYRNVSDKPIEKFE